MAVRPQCVKIATSLKKETAYGTAITPDTNIDQLWTPNEPVLLEMSQERSDDAELIKGHEFPADPAKDIVFAQDVQIPFSFPSSLEAIGGLMAWATGADAPSGVSPNFTHQYKAQDLCAGDQYLSTNWILGFVGDTASFKLVKGLIVNELRIAYNGQGYLTVSGTAFCDGTLTDKPAFTFPATSAFVDFILGNQGDFLTADAGSGLVSKLAKFRGFEFGINNNLDVGDARTLVAAGGKFLPELRPGNREYSLTVSVEGHQGDEFWIDYEAETEKDVQLTVTKNVNRSLDLRFRSCKISNISQSFDGIRDVNEITYKLFFNSTDNSPFLATVKNGIAEYLAA